MTSVYAPTNHLAALRSAVAATGNDVEERVIKRIRSCKNLRDQLPLCESKQDYVTLYERAEVSFGTATKRAIVAVDATRNIVIDGDFGIPQQSTSLFYTAYDSGIPCVLKFTPDAEAAAREARVYDAARSIGGEDAAHLVPVECLDFSSALPLPRHVAVKSDIYVSTLQTCPQDSRMNTLWHRGARSTLRALRALHCAGYVHCDVKPGNIFVSSRGLCLLGDYDAATATNQRITRTTDAFLPKELGLLKHSFEQQRPQVEWLIATPAVDFAMLASTILYLMKPVELPVGKGICISPAAACLQSFDERALVLSDSADPENRGIAEVLRTCLTVMLSDSQVTRGAQMLCEIHSARQASKIAVDAARDAISDAPFDSSCAPGLWSS